MHLLDLVNVSREFRRVGQDCGQVFTLLNKIWVAVTLSRTGLQRDANLRVGGKFGCHISTFCWSCVVWIVFIAPDGRWHGTIGGGGLGECVVCKSGAGAGRWSSTYRNVGWNGEWECHIVWMKFDLEDDLTEDQGSLGGPHNSLAHDGHDT